MANYYGNDQIEKLKNLIDIVNVIESYIPLKKQGSNFTACCPFHEEKTPSFVVYPDSQTFHCYGGSCNKGGDVIHFIQEIDKLTFTEAVEMLADRAGFTLVPQKKSSSGPPRSLKKEMFRANEFALLYFKKALSAKEASRARAYLNERGLSEKTIDRFNIGFGKPGIVAEIRKNKLNPEPFVKTGLIQKNSYSSSYYERFRDRIIFPIKDVQGRVTGFGGRTLEASDSRKYVNSPASPVFDKKQNLYGIEFLKKLSENGKAVIVEGYTDVIGLVQNGFSDAVATLGTALTEYHLKKLRRFTDSVIIIFDADEAGLRAAEKSIDLFIQKDMESSFVTLPDKKDPFEFIMENGLQKFRSQLKKASTMYTFKKNILSRRFEGNTPGAVSKMIRNIVNTFNKTPSPVKRELYFKQISEDFSISTASLEQTAAAKAPRGRAVPEGRAPTPSGPEETAVRNIIQTVIMFPVLFKTTARELYDAIIPDGMYKNIFRACLEQYEREGELVPEKLFSYIEGTEEAGIVSTFINTEKRLDPDVAERLNEESIIYLKVKDYKQEAEKLKKKYMEAENSGNEKMARKYMYQLGVIQKHRQTLTNNGNKHALTQ